ncbi:MAG TPA: alpha/beta fold hydrolase [Candidatus Thermoplasmatota archaeon]
MNLDGFDADLARIRAWPTKPRSLAGPSNWLNGILLFADFIASVPPTMSKLSSGWRSYPKDFEKVRFPSLDGIELVGWFGRSKLPGPRPGLILLPGLFTSKDNNRIRARSVRILREWGFHILTLDLRGIGESQRVRSTPGAKEADDIVAAIRWFEQNADAAPLHVYAESLAASAALVAVGREGKAGRELCSGRVLSVSPYADPRPILERFSGRIDWSDFSLAGPKALFKVILRMTGTGESEFDDYVANAANDYKIPLQDLLRDSTALEFIEHVRTPTAIIHSLDDSMVPVDHAHQLVAKANGNAAFGAILLPWGNHCLYEMAEPDWYWETLRAFFGAPPSPSKT